MFSFLEKLDAIGFFPLDLFFDLDFRSGLVFLVRKAEV